MNRREERTRLALRRRDGGVVLVWFVLLSFAIFGLLSVVADVGVARLTQRQMQGAVDAAVVEGLRPPESAQGPSPRARVQAQVAWVFDDDYDVSQDMMQFGAGPVVDLGPGVGSLNALQEIQGGSVYDPVLEENPSNTVFGDMVAGQFLPQVPGGEASDYVRQDFVPAGAGEGGTAFLLRMRRSHDPQGLDSVPGVSSRGPSIPLLFGRGALISGADPSAGYSPRHHGLTVRATAIADVEDRGEGRTRLKAAGPALGPGDPGGPLVGRTPWAIDLAAWETLAPGVARNVEVAPDGTISDGGTVLGRFASGADTLGAPALAAPSQFGPESGYVPVLDVIDGASRVIGYGFAQLIPVSGGGAGTDVRALTRLAPSAAPANGTAVINHRVAGRLGALFAGDPQGLTLLLARHRSFTGAVTAPILAR